mmetsp:Transcript_17714/g.39038  ORF Transcript_17714/g.39038 Transcript_17714/m.39038 type:complete len:288 (+) Transcript_17714:442-1305(+)
MPNTTRRLASSQTATKRAAARSAANRSSMSPVKTPTTEYRFRTPARDPSSDCNAALAAATTAAKGSSAAGRTEARLVRQFKEALRREHSSLVSPAMAVAPADCQRAGITDTSATARSKDPVASNAAGPTGAGDVIRGSNRSAVWLQWSKYNSQDACITCVNVSRAWHCASMGPVSNNSRGGTTSARTPAAWSVVAFSMNWRITSSAGSNNSGLCKELSPWQTGTTTSKGPSAHAMASSALRAAELAWRSSCCQVRCRAACTAETAESSLDEQDVASVATPCHPTAQR